MLKQIMLKNKLKSNTAIPVSENLYPLTFDYALAILKSLTIRQITYCRIKYIFQFLISRFSI